MKKEWQQHPVTMQLKKALLDKIEELKEAWAAGECTTLDDSNGGVAAIRALKATLDWIEKTEEEEE